MPQTKPRIARSFTTCALLVGCSTAQADARRSHPAMHEFAYTVAVIADTTIAPGSPAALGVHTIERTGVVADFAHRLEYRLPKVAEHVRAVHIASCDNAAPAEASAIAEAARLQLHLCSELTAAALMDSEESAVANTVVALAFEIAMVLLERHGAIAGEHRALPDPAALSVVVLSALGYSVGVIADAGLARQGQQPSAPTARGVHLATATIARMHCIAGGLSPSVMPLPPARLDECRADAQQSRRLAVHFGIPFELSRPGITITAARPRPVASSR